MSPRHAPPRPRLPRPRLRHRHAARRAHRRRAARHPAGPRPRRLPRPRHRPLERIPLREALRLRDVVEQERLITSRDPNHRAWLFHAFDRRTLEFFVARWQPLRQGGTYTAERRILVRRTRAVGTNPPIDRRTDPRISASKTSPAAS